MNIEILIKYKVPDEIKTNKLNKINIYFEYK